MDFNVYFRSRRGEIVGLLKELVLRESPSTDKKSVDACSAFFVEKCRLLGAKTTRFPQKGIGDLHLIEYPARDDDRFDGRLLVLAHVDTVWPVGRLGTMPFYIQGEKVFGPGTLDMKAGLVLAYSALKALRDLNLRPGKRIALFLNSAEESGDEAASEMILKLARGADRVLCLEPSLPGGVLKLQRKGRLVVRIEVRGRAAHGGSPEKGVSAVDELLFVLRKVQGLRSKEVSVNLGLLGGGEKANVVADSAWAVADIRFWTAAQRVKIQSFLKSLSPEVRGARIKVSIESVTPQMERTRSSTALFEEAKTVAAGLGQTLTGGRTGGGSDASIAAGIGRPTLDGLGPDGDGMHASHEHILLPSLIARAALLTELLRRL